MHDGSLVAEATVDFHPDFVPSWSIPSNVAHRLAITFGLTVAAVRTDAHDVATWRGPNDHDLLTTIETRRGLDAADAARYLHELRTELASLPEL